jgi:hypothetical protein
MSEKPDGVKKAARQGLTRRFFVSAGIDKGRADSASVGSGKKGTRTRSSVSITRRPDPVVDRAGTFL